MRKSKKERFIFQQLQHVSGHTIRNIAKSLRQSNGTSTFQMINIYIIQISDIIIVLTFTCITLVYTHLFTYFRAILKNINNNILLQQH